MRESAGGDALIEALRAVNTALDAGDVAAAEQATLRVVQACAVATEEVRQGAFLSVAQIEVARALQASCSDAATTTQAAVVAALLQSATHRKASDAYGSTS